MRLVIKSNVFNILYQMIQEEQKKLTEDQDSYQALLVQRQGDRQQLKKPQKPKKSTMAQLQQELTELQSKYAQLCTKLEHPVNAHIIMNWINV